MDEKALIKVGVKLVGLIFLVVGLIGVIQLFVQLHVASPGVDIPVAELLPSLLEMVIGWWLAKRTTLFIQWFWRD